MFTTLAKPLRPWPAVLARAKVKRNSDPPASKFRMAWILVMFDLPVGTKEQRRDAAGFRKDLLADGYIMLQFSVYARPCASADRAETHARRLKSFIPNKGQVRAMVISDAQWGRMIVVFGKKSSKPEAMPEQMMFF